MMDSAVWRKVIMDRPLWLAMIAVATSGAMAAWYLRNVMGATPMTTLFSLSFALIVAAAVLVTASYRRHRAVSRSIAEPSRHWRKSLVVRDVISSIPLLIGGCAATYFALRVQLADAALALGLGGFGWAILRLLLRRLL